MKLRISAIAAIILGLFIILNPIERAKAAPFPTNFDLDSLHKADKNPKQFDGRVIAFRGTITIVKKVPDGRPYFYVQMVDPNPNKEGIWVSGFSNIKEGSLAVGHNVGVLAYFGLTDPEDKTITAIQKTAYQALGFCIANATTQMGLYSKEGGDLCTQWQNGKIPVAEADSTKVRVIDTLLQKIEEGGK